MYSQRMHLRKKKAAGKCWITGWLKKRSKLSVYHDILQELRRHDLEHFRRYLRMNAKVYEVGYSLKQIFLSTGGSAQIAAKLEYFFNIILPTLKKQTPAGFRYYVLKLWF